MNKAEEKTLKGIVVFLAIASFVACYGFIAESEIGHLNISILIACVLFLWPVIIPICSLHFLKAKYNKVAEKKKNIYVVLFLIFNFLVVCFFIFLLHALNVGWLNW